jgi:hypothetical protein
MRNIIIHGHFYQPPREDPWLEMVPRELSAAPDHDWNARITRQCYAPLARAPVVDAEGRLTRLINAYAWCSFDIGPSLFRWFDEHAPDVAAAIIAGDRESAARTGHGNAIAMPYHHAIMPLLSRRDKVTEVRWGIRDFRLRFGRDPSGMWLPETAVDEETLTVLAEEQIRFTVLAPSQVTGYPPFGRPGRWTVNGRELALFVYDGPSAHYVAFGAALDEVGQWEQQLNASPLAEDGGVNAVSIATDGETFGHHHRLGATALASLIDRINRRDDAQFTNFAALLVATPPQHDLTLISPSSWSCPHGVDRWRRACGCHYEPNTSQEWRTPLRDGLETLGAGITEAVQRHWPAAAGDLWVARDIAGPDLAGAPELPAAARVLLEIEQHALAMFTSCAWFFDDIGRLEPRIVLRHAARAVELLPKADGARLEPALIATLAHARSNDPDKGDGATIWRRDVLPDAAGPSHLAAAIGALRELAPAALDDVRMPAHDWRFDGDDIITIHRRTGIESRWQVEPVTRGILAIHADVRAVPAGAARIVGIAAYPGPIRRALREIATSMVFDATLTLDDKAALGAGLLDRGPARDRALAGAWLLVARDGIDDAGIVVHSVLDLFDLDTLVIADGQRADAFEGLTAQPATPARDMLAERIGIVLS